MHIVFYVYINITVLMSVSVFTLRAFSKDYLIICQIINNKSDIKTRRSNFPAFCSILHNTVLLMN